MVAVDITISETQAGINQAVVDVEATETGPIIANTGTLNVLVSTVTGLSGTINIVDATLGRDIETDNEFRDRRIAT